MTHSLVCFENVSVDTDYQQTTIKTFYYDNMIPNDIVWFDDGQVY